MLSFSSLAAQDAAQEAVIEFTDHPARVVSNIDALRVRSSPAIEADNIVGHLQPGQQVHVLAREGEWQQVRSEDGLLGWSHSGYLIDLPPRQIGETRLFRIEDEFLDTAVLVHGELRHIRKYSYIYVVEHSRLGIHVDSDDLHRFAEEFDERSYPETFTLWPMETKPAHEGDERVVILLDLGYRNSGGKRGIYHGRGDMPGETYPYGNRTGFLEIVWKPLISTMSWSLLFDTTYHELQHLIQHHVDSDETDWINEGLSMFTSAYWGYGKNNLGYYLAFQEHPNTPLHDSLQSPLRNGAGFLFISYIYKRLGLEGLQKFALRPENGLAALDAILAERGGGLDTEILFADWVMANFLVNTQLGDGRYGYPTLSNTTIPKASAQGRITLLPMLIQESLQQYATNFYELALPVDDQPIQLELELRFPGVAAQDGWLQIAQVIDGDVTLQRFRVSDNRNQWMSATLEPDAELAFIAISPFREDARHLNAAAPYNLKIRIAGSEVAESEYVTTASTTSVNTADAKKAIEHRSPTQLAMEIEATLNEIIGDSNGGIIIPEYTTGVFIARVEELLAAGADISNSSGSNLLTKAVLYFKSSELISLLLEGGANPNRGIGSFSVTFGGSRESIPGSPLNYAVFFEDVASIELHSTPALSLTI